VSGIVEFDRALTGESKPIGKIVYSATVISDLELLFWFLERLGFD